MERGVEIVDGRIERRRELRRREAGGSVRASQATVECGVQERGAGAVGGKRIAEGARDAADDAVEPKPAEIVGHCAGAVAGQAATKQGSHQWTQITIAEAGGQMAEVAECSEQRLRARIAEAQGRHALAGPRPGWQLQTFKAGRRRDRSVRDALDLQQFGIDLPPDRAQVGQGVQTFGPLEVEWIVDGSFCPQSALLFEVLLDVGMLVVDVQAGRDAVGNHARLVAETWWRRASVEPRWKQEADAIGATEVQIVANDRFEELATVDRHDGVTTCITVSCGSASHPPQVST